MPLRVRISLIVVLAVVLYAGLDYCVQTLVVLPRFHELEREEARNDAQRAREALAREIVHLDTLVLDWSAWNETYRFVEDRNKDYVNDTLNEETLEADNLNLLYITDAGGGLVWGMTRCPELTVMESCAQWEALFPGLAGKLLHGDDPRASTAGVGLSTKGPMLLASRPILTSEQAGPVRGTLVMGRLLDEEAVTGIAEQTRTELAVKTADGADAPVAPPGEVFAVQEDKDVLVVRSAVNGIDGSAALLLETTVPREISRKGREASRLAVASLLFAGVLLLVLMLAMLQRTIIGPIVRLTGTVSELVRNPGMPPDRLRLGRKDEIGVLAAEFERSLRDIQKRDRMLASMAESSDALLRTPDLEATIPQVLAGLGEAAGVDGMHLLTCREEGARARSAAGADGRGRRASARATPRSTRRTGRRCRGSSGRTPRRAGCSRRTRPAWGSCWAGCRIAPRPSWRRWPSMAGSGASSCSPARSRGRGRKSAPPSGRRQRA